MWRALRAFGGSRGVACGPRRQFAGAGWKASRRQPATSAQRGRSRTQVTELARMECARSAAAARRRADGLGSIDSALRRRYARSLEPLPEANTARGTSKSAVSERFVYGTERKLAELMSRDLRELPLVALLIDGVHFAEHVVLAAVGVDDRGIKHVLGLREGATENAAVVRALLGELVEPGLDPTRSLFVVIDGAKALHKAVVQLFGSHALIQRCREHKKRNVTEALPERLRATV